MPIARMSLGDAVERIDSRFAVRVVTRWYTQQTVLKFRNDTDDIVITFRCNKGTFEVKPREKWEHAFVLPSSALTAMKSVEITRAVQNGRRLAEHECELVLTEHSMTFMTQAIEEGPKKRGDSHWHLVKPTNGRRKRQMTKTMGRRVLVVSNWA